MAIKPTGIDFALTAARGKIPNITCVNKFGRAPTGVQTSATDIWDQADATPTKQIWVPPTQARVHAIVSTDDVDGKTASPNSTGARTLRVYGLTDWDTAEVSEDITLTGTDSVNTTNSYVIIHRMHVLTKGNNASGPNVGTITATAAGDSTVTAQINAKEGQTQMAIYGIPSTQSAYITRYYGTINKAQAAAVTVNFSLKVNPEPDSERINYLVKNTRGLQSTGCSSDTWEFYPYMKVQGPAIIKIQGLASALDVEASAGFDLLLVTN